MLPNLLATRKGRLAAFFALYVTEGIPLGFAATAVAYYLRKLGVGPAEIGAFVGSFYLPWAFKWAFGPLVDVFRSQRWGHRRAWILGTQLIMAATLARCVWTLSRPCFLTANLLCSSRAWGAATSAANCASPSWERWGVESDTRQGCPCHAIARTCPRDVSRTCC